MNLNKSCNCSLAPKLIFSCSGAADVGEIADHAARKLSRKGAGKMFCLAGIGGKVSSIVKSTEAAQAILAIDGCPMNCAKNVWKKLVFRTSSTFKLLISVCRKGKPSQVRPILIRWSRKERLYYRLNVYKNKEG